MDINVIVTRNGEPAPIIMGQGKLVMSESFDLAAPTLSIGFNDMLSFFRDYSPYASDDEFRFIISSADNSLEYLGVPFTSTNKDVSTLSTAQFNQVDFVHKNALKLYNSYGFVGGKTKVSEQVKKIAQHLEVEHDIEDTDEVRSLICPNWKTTQWLRYLSTAAVSSGGSSAYQYFLTKEGKLVFRSVDSLFENPITEEDLILQPSHDMIRFPRIGRILGALPLLGANRSKYSYYDITKGEVVEEEMGVDSHTKSRGDLNSDNAKIQDIVGSKYLGVVCTEDSKYPFNLSKEVIKRSLLQQESEIITVSSYNNVFKRKLGGLVNVTIPSADGEAVARPMSGKYVIKSIKTVVTNTIVQTLTLVRKGYNNYE